MSNFVKTILTFIVVVAALMFFAWLDQDYSEDFQPIIHHKSKGK